MCDHLAECDGACPLQAGTTHDLGDNFARAFDTKYLNEKNKECFVHQSSWGVSTRLVGGVVMSHGDDQGLRLPPNLAPVQVLSLPQVISMSRLFGCMDCGCDKLLFVMMRDDLMSFCTKPRENPLSYCSSFIRCGQLM